MANMFVAAVDWFLTTCPTLAQPLAEASEQRRSEHLMANVSIRANQRLMPALTASIAQMHQADLTLRIARLTTDPTESWEDCKMRIIESAADDVLELCRLESGKICQAKLPKITLAFSTGTCHDPDGARMQMVVLLHPAGSRSFGPLGNGYALGTIHKVDIARCAELIALHMQLA
jgi:hypothetical protein